MSGILDNKSRVIDTIITTEGRRQLALGGIDIKYVSFTDNATFYKADLASGSQDATQRIYFESCQLPQDEITFQADDEGNVQTFSNTDGVQLAGGRILDYSFAAVSSSFIGDADTTPGAAQSVVPVQGARFADMSEKILASAANNFANMRIIATHDRIFEDDGFGLGPNAVTFSITDTRPIPNQSQQSTHISALDSIFADPRFSDKPNFKYLPPVNKISDTSLDRGDPRVMRPFNIGYYTPWGRTHVDGLSYKQIMHELKYYQSLGYMQQINIDPTSSDNNLVGQFFEKSYNTLRKLDVIDFGNFQTGNASSPVAHIFFVGKLEVDEKGTDTFLHIFTLVFE